MNERSKSRVRGWVAALATALAGVAAVPAQAAVFVTNWDPRFDVAFDGVSGLGFDLGWRGTASIDVAPGCTGVSTTIFMVGPCAGAATLLSYGLVLYDDTTFGDPPVASLGGAGPALPDPTAVSFDGSGVVDGMDLAGFLTSIFPVALGSTNWLWELDFVLGSYVGPTLKLTYHSGGTGCGGVGQPSCVLPYTSSTTGDNVPVSTWRIPEPTTLALVGAAVLGLRLRRRA